MQLLLKTMKMSLNMKDRSEMSTKLNHFYTSPQDILTPSYISALSVIFTVLYRQTDTQTHRQGKQHVLCSACNESE